MALFLNLVILAALIAAFAWWYYRGRHMGAFKPAFGSARNSQGQAAGRHAHAENADRQGLGAG